MLSQGKFLHGLATTKFLSGNEYRVVLKIWHYRDSLIYNVSTRRILRRWSRRISRTLAHLKFTVLFCYSPHWNYCPPDDSGLQYLYWFFMCWLNDPEWLKLLLQCGQRNGFSPLCRRSCSVRWCLCLKAFLQTSQTNGR